MTGNTSLQRLRETYGTVVDVVEAGADESGMVPIDSVVERVADHDTAVLFPDGEYLFDRIELRDLDDFALVAVPGATPVLRPATPARDHNHIALWFREMDRFRFDGFTFDYRASGHGGVIQITDSGSFRARNLGVRGVMPDRESPNNPAVFRFDVTDPGGRGIVQNVSATDGGHENGIAVGMYVGKDHAGELHVRDCEIANFPNNGLYASAPGRQLENFTGANGSVHVFGGEYRNNNIANIRIGSSGSTVMDATVVMDEIPPAPSRSKLNVRGIRLRNREAHLVDNCDIVIGRDAGRGFGGIVYHPECGHATVRNTRIQVDRDGYPAINTLRPPNEEALSGLRFERVEITGDAGKDTAVVIRHRDETVFQNCAVEQTGRDRDGITFRGARNCRVIDSNIQVTGTPIQEIDAMVEMTNTVTSDSGDRP